MSLVLICIPALTAKGFQSFRCCRKLATQLEADQEHNRTSGHDSKHLTKITDHGKVKERQIDTRDAARLPSDAQHCGIGCRRLTRWCCRCIRKPSSFRGDHKRWGNRNNRFEY
jgi:hypothetical protein